MPYAQHVMRVYLTAALYKSLEQRIILIFFKCIEAHWWQNGCSIYYASLMAGTLWYRKKERAAIWDYIAWKKPGCKEAWIINFYHMSVWLYSKCLLRSPHSLLHFPLQRFFSLSSFSIINKIHCITGPREHWSLIITYFQNCYRLT